MSREGSTLHIEIRAAAGDPLCEALNLLDAMPAHDPDRLEAEAQLYLVLARSCWRQADRARELARRRQTRENARPGPA